MATYAIGDVQGCYPELQRLLEKLRFDPARDQLWFCGDLVNRGGQSLETLRLIHELRESCVVTLGNHDLSLLAISQRRPDAQARVNPELREVLFAADAPVLFEWMRSQKLLHPLLPLEAVALNRIGSQPMDRIVHPSDQRCRHVVVAGAKRETVH